MSETQDQKSFLKRYWEGYEDKEHLAERFSFFPNLEKPLPHGKSSSVEKFIPKPTVLAPPLGYVGALLGGSFGVELGLKYWKSGYGVALSFGIGAVIGWTYYDWMEKLAAEERKKASEDRGRS